MCGPEQEAELVSTDAAACSCSPRRAASSTLKPRAAAWRAAAAPMPEEAPVTTAHDARSLAAEACAASSAKASANMRHESADPTSARTNCISTRGPEIGRKAANAPPK